MFSSSAKVETAIVESVVLFSSAQKLKKWIYGLNIWSVYRQKRVVYETKYRQFEIFGGTASETLHSVRFLEDFLNF